MRAAAEALLPATQARRRHRRNAIRQAGFEPVDVESKEDIENAKVLVFPGVGAFGSAMSTLHAKGYAEPLKE